MSNNYPVNLQIIQVEAGNRCVITTPDTSSGVCFKPVRHRMFKHLLDIPMCGEHDDMFGSGNYIAVSNDNGTWNLALADNTAAARWEKK